VIYALYGRRHSRLAAANLASSRAGDVAIDAAN